MERLIIESSQQRNGTDLAIFVKVRCLHGMNCIT